MRGLREKIVAFGLAAALLSAASQASAEDLLSQVKASGELVVGTEFQFAPFDFVEDGAQQGVNSEIFAEIGKELGVKVTFIDLPWDSVLPGLEAGKFQVVAGPVTITKARMERYRFTPPIADATVALLKRADDDGLAKPEDIAGKVVGGGKASAQLAQLKAFVETLPEGAEVREYVDNNQAYADLAAGRIVAVGNSLPNIAYIATQRPETFAVVMPPFGEKVYFGYVGRKDADSAPLLDAIDAVIAEMQTDGRLAAIQEKWFGVKMDVPAAVTDPAF